MLRRFRKIDYAALDLLRSQLEQVTISSPDRTRISHIIPGCPPLKYPLRKTPLHRTFMVA